MDMNWVSPRQQMNKIEFPRVVATIELVAGESTRPLNTYKHRDESLFCCYCGKQFSFDLKVTADHLIPRSKGGRNNNYNKRNCCPACNSAKGSLYPEQWLSVIKKRRSKLKFDVNPAAKAYAYELDILIENISYIVEYVQSAGVRLFIDKYHHEWYLDRRNRKV